LSEHPQDSDDFGYDDGSNPIFAHLLLKFYDDGSIVFLSGIHGIHLVVTGAFYFYICFRISRISCRDDGSLRGRFRVFRISCREHPNIQVWEILRVFPHKKNAWN
jgi:hypothetical protein